MNRQTDRKIFLRVVLKLMFTITVLVVAFVLLRYSSRDNVREEIITIDLSDLAAGEHKIVRWQNRPIIILHRTKLMLETIKSGEEDNPFLVVYAQSPDYSCPITVVQPDEKEKGGFKSECSGTLYDYAGRLLPNQNARFNLEEPDYSIEGNVLTIGIKE
ncbi:MAG TPA: hypothetical protein EYH06_05015 [Chromatiales bacterium]|nr:hypothetical protein [Thiotrichales bacterium]HIP67937.1 hypothetical protein [Chromatiales bacterium]